MKKESADSDYWTLRFVFVSAEAFEADDAFLLMKLPHVGKSVAMSFLLMKAP